MKQKKQIIEREIKNGGEIKPNEKKINQKGSERECRNRAQTSKIPTPTNRQRKGIENPDTHN